MKLLKYPSIEQRFTAGTLTVADLSAEGVSPDDWVDFREKSGVRSFGATRQGADQFAKKNDDGSYPFVFVTESPIGWMQDVPLATSWRLGDYYARKSPILFVHDSDSLPIGSGKNVKRDQPVRGFRSLTGNVALRAPGRDPRADMVREAIDDGILNCFSVGFRVGKARKPTEDETRMHKLGAYATILEECYLDEGSIVPVGRDPQAGILRYGAAAAQLEEWVAGRRDRFEPEVVREFRFAVLGRGAGTGRTVVTQPGLPEGREGEDVELALDVDVESGDEPLPAFSLTETRTAPPVQRTGAPGASPDLAARFAAPRSPSSVDADLRALLAVEFGLEPERIEAIAAEVRTAAAEQFDPLAAVEELREELRGAYALAGRISDRAAEMSIRYDDLRCAHLVLAEEVADMRRELAAAGIGSGGADGSSESPASDEIDSAAVTDEEPGGTGAESEIEAEALEALDREIAEMVSASDDDTTTEAATAAPETEGLTLEEAAEILGAV